MIEPKPEDRQSLFLEGTELIGRISANLQEARKELEEIRKDFLRAPLWNARPRET